MAALHVSSVAPARAQTTPPDPAGEAPAAATTGHLEIATELPGARILLDGQELGVTPLRKEGLPTGEHEIQVEQQGLPAVTRKVVIRQGETLRIDVAPPALPDPALVVTPLSNPSPQPQPPSPVMAAGNDVLVSVLAVPWGGAAIAITVGFLLAATVFWISKPEELPFSQSLPFAVTPGVWRVGQYGTLAGAALFGVLATILVVLTSEPIAKMATFIATAVEKKSAAPASK